MEIFFQLLLPVLIVSTWAGMVLVFVSKVREEVSTSNRLLARIEASLSEIERTRSHQLSGDASPNDEDEEFEPERFWCFKCKAYYMTDDSFKCPNCGVIGHPDE